MPKKDDEGIIISETGNWNVADNYTKIKIMKPLAAADYYEDIAAFGYDSIIEELVNYKSPPNDFIRFTGLKRLVSELIKLINNAKFALKKQGTKNEVIRYLTILTKIKKHLPDLITVSRDEVHKTSEVRIKSYSSFEEILSFVSKIKSKINEPLNRNHLIFVDKEEFDPLAFKEKLKNRIVNKG